MLMLVSSLLSFIFFLIDAQGDDDNDDDDALLASAADQMETEASQAEASQASQSKGPDARNACDDDDDDDDEWSSSPTLGGKKPAPASMTTMGAGARVLVPETPFGRQSSIGPSSSGAGALSSAHKAQRSQPNTPQQRMAAKSPLVRETPQRLTAESSPHIASLGSLVERGAPSSVGGVASSPMSRMALSPVVNGNGHHQDMDTTLTPRRAAADDLDVSADLTMDRRGSDNDDDDDEVGDSQDEEEVRCCNALAVFPFCLIA
jgi:hypothetical protein